MRQSLLPRYFALSVLLLLVLVGVYIFFEARRFQDELLRQAEAKGLALTDAMESNIRASVLANSLLEELIGQRLLDNARLIDDLLQFPPTDAKALQQIAAANRLSKIELLDVNGRALDALPAPSARRMQEMMSRMGKPPSDEAVEHRRAMMFMWGRRWPLAQERINPPPKIAEKKFWEGSAFGVAIGARSFPGIIAVHANADYLLNFRKQIEVQRQVEELGQQSDIDHIVLVDKNLNVLAQTPSQASPQGHDDALLLQVKAHGAVGHGIVQRLDGSKHFDVVKPLDVNGSRFGFLEIGLSLQPMETAWRRSLGSMAIVGLGILGVGILGMAAIFHDQRRHLQNVRALEEEIHRKERLSELGSLAATVAHEIRNPLNSISMGMQRLKAEFTPVQDANEYSHFLTLMQNEVERLNRTVEQFLSLARPLKLSPEPIHIEELIGEITTLLDAQAQASNVQMQFKTAPGLPPVWADRNYLKQLLLNLILNGIQAMSAGGPLSLEAFRENQSLQLTVRDRGTGIQPGQLGKIFEPYFTTKPSGSGLGLAIARRIAEAHGGKINVQSEPGQGACFCVSLPLGNEP